MPEFPLNGSTLINQPFNTTFSPFTRLFGEGFFIIPISVIAVALYVKTRSPVVVSAWLIGSGLLMSGGGLFLNFSEMGIVYTIISGIGVIGLFASVYFQRGGG